MLALNTDNGRIWLVVHWCYTSVCRETEAVFALWRMNIIVLASINFNDSDNGEYDIVVALNISDCNYQWRTETKFKINMSKSLVHTLKYSPTELSEFVTHLIIIAPSELHSLLLSCFVHTNGTNLDIAYPFFLNLSIVTVHIYKDHLSIYELSNLRFKTIIKTTSGIYELSNLRFKTIVDL